MPVRPSSTRSRRRTRLPPGTVIVRYRELLAAVDQGTTRFLFVPGSSGLAHLDARGAMYEMYRLRGPVKIQYKAAVGTTTNGEILMGVDYDAKDYVNTYQGTAALSPKAMAPVWRDATLTVPQGRAMKQKWLVTATDMNTAGTGTPANYRSDAIAFAYQVTSTGTASTGSIWVEYNVEFASPKVPEPPVALSLLSYGSSTSSPTSKAFMSETEPGKCPVPPGGTFYAGLANGNNITANSGYRIVSTPYSDSKMKIYEIANDSGTLGGDWATIVGLANQIAFFASSSGVASIKRVLNKLLGFQ